MEELFLCCRQEEEIQYSCIQYRRETHEAPLVLPKKICHGSEGHGQLLDPKDQLGVDQWVITFNSNVKQRFLRLTKRKRGEDRGRFTVGFRV
jgi:hypothetical protein